MIKSINEMTFSEGSISTLNSRDIPDEINNFLNQSKDFPIQIYAFTNQIHYFSNQVNFLPN